MSGMIITCSTNICLILVGVLIFVLFWSALVLFLAPTFTMSLCGTVFFKYYYVALLFNLLLSDFVFGLAIS